MAVRSRGSLTGADLTDEQRTRLFSRAANTLEDGMSALDADGHPDWHARAKMIELSLKLVGALGGRQGTPETKLALAIGVKDFGPKSEILDVTPRPDSTLALPS